MSHCRHGAPETTVCRWCRRNARRRARAKAARPEGPPLRRHYAKRVDVDLGDKLVVARRILGWDQRAVAGFLRMVQNNGNSISQWENGQTAIPLKHVQRVKDMIDYARLVREERDKRTLKRLREAGFTV